jgi:hypothetical protein
MITNEGIMNLYKNLRHLKDYAWTKNRQAEPIAIIMHPSDMKYMLDNAWLSHKNTKDLILQYIDNVYVAISIYQEINTVTIVTRGMLDEMKELMNKDDNIKFEDIGQKGKCKVCEKERILNYEGVCIECNLKGV